MKLTPKLTLLFVFFAAALLVVVNFLAYSTGRAMLEAAAISELEATAGEKQAFLNAWLDEKQADIQALADDPYTVKGTYLLKITPSEYVLPSIIHSHLLQEFRLRVSGGEFLSVMLLDSRTGNVLVSTDPNEGDKPADVGSFFLKGKQGTHLTSIYFSQEHAAPVLSTSAPVIADDGLLLGVLVGRVNLEELNDIVQRRSGLRQTHDAFLVNASHQPITQPRFLPDPSILQHGIYTVPVNTCLQRKSGTVLANDFRNIPVVAAYRWLPEHQICLIVKISQQEALAEEHSWAVTNALIGLAGLLVALLIALGLSHTLIAPIRAMQTAAQRYREGDLTVRLTEIRRDELGLLAREFNALATTVAEKENQLRSYSRELENRVVERTRDLQKSQDLLSKSQAISHLGSWELDLINQHLIWSDEVYQICGLRVQEFEPTYEAFLEIVHPGDRAFVDESYSGSIRDRKDMYEVEHRIVRRDNGETRFVYIKCENIQDPSGQIIRSAGMIQDITERKQAEMQLADALEFTERILTSAPIGIFTYRLSGQCLSANAAAAQMVGAALEQLHSQNFCELESWKQSGLYDLAQRAIATKQPISDDVHVHTTFGKDAWYRVQFVTFRSAAEELLLMIFNDITERKHAEEALREKERLLSDAQHIGQIGSLIYDIRAMTLQFSDEIYHLLDVPPENFHHDRKDLLALIYPSDRPLAVKWIDDMRTGIQSKDLEFRVFRRNGEMRYLHCHGAVEFNSDGKPTRFVGTMQDITERKLAEIQISQQIKRLTSLSEIDRAIISGAGQPQILEVILSQAISQLQVDAAGILLLNLDQQTLHYAAGQGFRSQYLGEIRVPFGESQAGRVAKDRRLIRIPDLGEQTQDPFLNILVKEEGFVSYVGVPLIVKREVRGVLEVFHRAFFQPYQEWLDFLHALARQTAIALENAVLLGSLQASNQELAQAYDATLEGWSRAMDLRDRETEGHTRRVTELTLKVARAMRMSEDQLVHIRRGALLHDIGKLGIPDHILFKQDKLTPEEWEIMQKHPEYAYEMLSSIQYLKPALVIPYFHHEKWDGSGYPLGLQGEQIPLEARIFSVVDVWDALLSDRPYRKAWTGERTLDYIQTLAGNHLDPNVVNCFMQLMKP